MKQNRMFCQFQNYPEKRCFYKSVTKPSIIASELKQIIFNPFTITIPPLFDDEERGCQIQRIWRG